MEKTDEYWEGVMDTLLPMQLLLSLLLHHPPRNPMDAILDMKIILDDTRKNYDNEHGEVLQV